MPDSQFLNVKITVECKNDLGYQVTKKSGSFSSQSRGYRCCPQDLSNMQFERNVQKYAAVFNTSCENTSSSSWFRNTACL